MGLTIGVWFGGIAGFGLVVCCNMVVMQCLGSVGGIWFACIEVVAYWLVALRVVVF